MAKVTLTSRAFCTTTGWASRSAELGALTGTGMVLPMNTGAEAVETRIKTARKVGVSSRSVSRGTRPVSSAALTISTAHRHGHRSRPRAPTATGLRAVHPRLHDDHPLRRRERRSRRRSRKSRPPSLVGADTRVRPGINVPPAGYLKALPRFCTRKNVPVHGRRDPDRPRPHREALRVTMRVKADIYILEQGARRRVYPVSAIAGSAAVLGPLPARRSTDRRSAGTRRRGRSAARAMRVTCRARSSSSGRPRWARTLSGPAPGDRHAAREGTPRARPPHRRRAQEEAPAARRASAKAVDGRRPCSARRHLSTSSASPAARHHERRSIGRWSGSATR